MASKVMKKAKPEKNQKLEDLPLPSSVKSMSEITPMDETMKRIVTHSEYFNQLVNLIPAKFYLLSNQDESSAPNEGGWVKYGVNVNKRKAPKEQVKENTKKAKKLRLDPSQHKTTIDTQVEVVKQRSEHLIKEAAAGDEYDSDSEDGSEDEMSEDDDDENMDGHEKVEKAGERHVKLNENPAQSVAELRERLAKRLAGFQTKRKMDDEKSDAYNKAKAREMRELKKKKKSEDKKGVSAPSADRPSRMHIKAKNGEDAGEGENNTDIVYSKFDFSALEKEKKKKAKKSNDLKMLLEKAESEKKAMHELRETDPEKAKELALKKLQKKAVEMAQGIKQQDDPSLLRKAIKRKEKQKFKSAKTWAANTKAVKTAIKQKEYKRDLNLKARVDAKKEKKIARGKGKKVKSTKKPSKRAGFEGKSKNPSKSSGKKSKK
eukprot:CFRG4686T1